LKDNWLKYFETVVFEQFDRLHWELHVAHIIDIDGREIFEEKGQAIKLHYLCMASILIVKNLHDLEYSQRACYFLLNFQNNFFTLWLLIFFLNFYDSVVEIVDA
jgi:hypothetical protein